MHGSAGGPLGALLLIAPLAAIPVFAIMGVPQFTSVVASSGDEDEFADLGDSATSLDAPGSIAAGRSESVPKSRADDLFAPLPDSPAPADTGRSPRQMSQSFADPRKNFAREPRAKATLPPADALDNWEVRPGPAEMFPEKSAGDSAGRNSPSRSIVDESTEALQIPADGTEDGVDVPAEFVPDLLKPGPQRARPENRLADGDSTRTTPSPRPDLKKNILAEDLAPSRVPDAIPDAISEQSGWQIAARRLKELRIRKYSLESQIEEQTFTFKCFFPSPGNPRVVTRFEAEADNPLEAVEKVLSEIDDWRNRDEMAAVPRE